MSPLERVEVLGRLLKFRKKRRRVGKSGEPARAVVVVDVDSALKGKPGFECVPSSLSFSGQTQGVDVEVRVLINGKLLTVGNLSFRFNVVGEDNRMKLSRAAYDRLMDIGRV